MERQIRSLGSYVCSSRLVGNPASPQADYQGKSRIDICTFRPFGRKKRTKSRLHGQTVGAGKLLVVRQEVSSFVENLLAVSADKPLLMALVMTCRQSQDSSQNTSARAAGNHQQLSPVTLLFEARHAETLLQSRDVPRKGREGAPRLMLLTFPTRTLAYKAALEMLTPCCSCDVAATSDIIWEGYMGANKAAFLFGKVLNLEPAAEPRKQQLSTGTFLLQDMRCRTCSTPFGWSYLKAWSQASLRAPAGFAPSSSLGFDLATDWLCPAPLHSVHVPVCMQCSVHRCSGFCRIKSTRRVPP